MKLFQIDAFATAPFTGNPAAVCLLTEPRGTEWMQSLAAEMNLSETAYLEHREDGWGLRWFTPAMEVDLCGHATLASAHLLWETGSVAPDAEARFHTRSGVLTAVRRPAEPGERTSEEHGELIELNFPATPLHPVDPPPGLVEALGVVPLHVSRGSAADPSQADYLIEVESEAAVRRTQPDFGLLGRIEARGVMVTARGTDSGVDIVSRFFAPVAGVDEDPVTGSAHCCLGPFWGQRLGKDSLTAFQASSRGGTVYLRLDGDRVRLAGRAVTVMEAMLRV